MHTKYYEVPPTPEDFGLNDPNSPIYGWDEDRWTELDGMAAMEWVERTAISPDGRFVFGLEADRDSDPEPTVMPDYLTERVTVRETRRKLADERPSSSI